MNRSTMNENIDALKKAKIISETSTGRTMIYKLNQFIITRLPNGVMPNKELNAEFIVKENNKE